MPAWTSTSSGERLQSECFNLGRPVMARTRNHELESALGIGKQRAHIDRMGAKSFARAGNLQCSVDTVLTDASFCHRQGLILFNRYRGTPPGYFLYAQLCIFKNLSQSSKIRYV